MHDRFQDLIGQTLVVGSMAASYFWMRGVVEGSGTDARANAAAILDVESSLGLDIEREWNMYVSGRAWLEVAFDAIYMWGYWAIVAGGLVFLWWRDRTGYRVLRNGLALAAVIGIVVYWRYPVAPPRALDGYVDTVYGVSGADGRPAGGTNVYAAMPSYHVGWPLAVGVCIAPLARTARGRLMAVLPAAVLAITVIVTANHYVVDVLAGALISMACIWVTAWWEAQRMTTSLLEYARVQT